MVNLITKSRLRNWCTTVLPLLLLITMLLYPHHSMASPNEGATLEGERAKIYKVFVNEQFSYPIPTHRNYLPTFLKLDLPSWMETKYSKKDAEFEVILSMKSYEKKVMFNRLLGMPLGYFGIFAAVSLALIELNDGTLDHNRNIRRRNILLDALGGGLTSYLGFSWATDWKRDGKFKYTLKDTKIEVINLETGYKINRDITEIISTNYVRFIQQVNENIGEEISKAFLELRKESDHPKITLEPTYKKTISASWLRIPIQVSDDVELASISLECPESFSSQQKLLGGYISKSVDFTLPLSVGSNTIKLSVKDWSGKTTAKILNIYALKDNNNTTYTIGNTPKNDQLIKESPLNVTAMRSDINVDIVPKTDMNNPNSYALVIGNMNYESVPNVDYGIRDAEIVREYLVKSFGLKEQNIIYLEDATLSNIKTSIKKLQNWSSGDVDDIYFYYSGHGAPNVDQKDAYLVPVDCDPNYVTTGGFPLAEIYESLSTIDAKNTTVIIDACFSGNSAAGQIINNASPIYIEVDKPKFFGKGITILTSASGSQISSWYPEMGHSLFTYYYLLGLQGKADDNNDRIITIAEINQFVESNVPGVARRLYNREQTPTFYTNDNTRVLLTY